jgi:hypothetical protein
MLTPGNKKLGGHLIWGFGLPSGAARVCPGMTPTCHRHCYAVRVERYRPRAAARYRHNLALSRLKDFARRVRAFLVAHHIRVVRIHTGGDFYGPAYACKWLQVMSRSPRVRFFFYTRSWRVPAIKAVLDALAALPNCRVWYSADADTGPPADVPPGVRVAWLMTTEDDSPPAGSDLAFRVHPLRRRPLAEVNGVRVCPAEDGLDHPRPPTCDRCGICWRPADGPSRGGRVSLPVIVSPDPTDTRGAS